MPKLSVTVITKNEAANIERALTSVAWADEVIVVDAESTDDTTRLAKNFTERVFVRAWPGYVDQKNYAASLATHDWVFSIDADECVTPQLAAALQRTLSTAPDAAGYQMPRVTQHLGRWIRTTDWYPDYQLRLYDRRRAAWSGRYVHEGVQVNGTIGRLDGELQHFPYRNLAEHLDTINRYTTDAARQMFESGRRSGPIQCALHPPAAFLRNYLLRGGFRDGSVGFSVSAMNAYYVFLKSAKLWELERVQSAL